MKKFCEFLRKQMKNIIDFENKNVAIKKKN